MTEQEAAKLLAKLGLPEHMQEGVIGYLVHRIEPGGFLRAVLENDLMEAASRADHINKHCLFEWAQLLYDLPRNTWGSKEVVSEWLRGK